MDNHSVLESIYEGVLDENPDLDLNEETRKVAQTLSLQLFRERSI